MDNVIFNRLATSLYRDISLFYHNNIKLTSLPVGLLESSLYNVINVYLYVITKTKILTSTPHIYINND